MLTRRNLLGSLLSGLGIAPAVTKVEVLRIEPDDIVLITVSGVLSPDSRAQIGKQFKEHTGCRKVLVQPEGMKAEIIRRA